MRCTRVWQRDGVRLEGVGTWALERWGNMGRGKLGALGGHRVDEDAENGDAVVKLERVGGTRAARRVVVHDVELARMVLAVHRVLAAPPV